MWRTLQRVGLLLLAGVLLGLAVNAVSPRGIPLVAPPKHVAPNQTIGLAEAEQLWRGGAIFLDARSRADYEAGHIGNALNLSVQDFSAAFAQVGPMLPPQMPVVVYCDGLECELSHRLRQRLVAAGFSNVRVLVNGWSVWRQAGLPTSQGGGP